MLTCSERVGASRGPEMRNSEHRAQRVRPPYDGKYNLSFNSAYMYERGTYGNGNAALVRWPYALYRISLSYSMVNTYLIATCDQLLSGKVAIACGVREHQ